MDLQSRPTLITEMSNLIRRSRKTSRIDVVDKVERDRWREIKDEEQSCFGKCYSRHKANLKKSRSTTANILLCTGDSYTDAWAAYRHYE